MDDTIAEIDARLTRFRGDPFGKDPRAWCMVCALPWKAHDPNCHVGFLEGVREALVDLENERGSVYIDMDAGIKTGDLERGAVPWWLMDVDALDVMLGVGATLSLMAFVMAIWP